MQKTVGLWIDHKKAVIVFVDGRDTELKVISSDIEKHHRQSGVATPADDIRQRALTAHLNSFYDEVVSIHSRYRVYFDPWSRRGERRTEQAAGERQSQQTHRRNRDIRQDN